MPKFRKKPVVIEAWPVSEIIASAAHDWAALPASVKAAYECGEFVFTDSTIYVTTLEGTHIASKDDYLICGVNGEFYGCKPDIFELTYEPAD